VRNPLSYPIADSSLRSKRQAFGRFNLRGALFLRLPHPRRVLCDRVGIVARKITTSPLHQTPPITLVIPNRFSGEESAFLSNSRFLAPLKTTSFLEVQAP
jgi:hypothetical protein